MSTERGMWSRRKGAKIPPTQSASKLQLFVHGENYINHSPISST